MAYAQTSSLLETEEHSSAYIDLCHYAKSNPCGLLEPAVSIRHTFQKLFQEIKPRWKYGHLKGSELQKT